jgi:hypothetical protein
MRQAAIAGGLLVLMMAGAALAQGPLVPMGVPPSAADSSAAPASVDSAYTDLNLSQCTVMQSDDFGSTWACAGHRGYPVMVSEGDLRFMLSYGLTPKAEKAASQTLPPFNNLGPRIEWRLSRASGSWMPVATIVRYLIDKVEPQTEGGEVLVVTRLGEGTTCQTAWIDAKANADANALAREAADRAQAFDCSGEPEIVGEWKAWER